MATQKTVCVIGAGISGLVSVKSCLEEGMKPFCFEQHSDIGGVWYDTDELRVGQGPRVYDNLLTNSSKDMMCFSDFPYPRDCPPYLTGQMVHTYLHDYADHFQLKNYIEFNTTIVKVSKAGDYEATGKWDVLTENAEGDLTSLNFDFVMVCSGFYKIPRFPKIDGLEQFEGFKTHSQTFKTGEIYKDKSILVVGNANSAGDIASNISRFAKQVYLSVGDGCWILTRLTKGGIPRDFLHRRFLLQTIPDFLVNNIIRKEADMLLSHESIGISPVTSPLKSSIMMNDEIQMHIMSGKVKVVRKLKKLDKRCAFFDDGHAVCDLDGIVFATGFHKDLSFLDSSVGGDEEKVEFYKMTFPVHLRHQTIAMIGCFSTVGAHPPAFELQARLASRVFASKHYLPCKDVMVKDVKKWNAFVKDQSGYYKYKFPTLLIRDNIAAELGLKPKFWDLIWTDPELALNCYFGPSFPVQYRLSGGGSWEGARNACFEAYNNNTVSKNPPKQLQCSNKATVPIYLHLIMLALLFGICLISILYCY